MIYTKNVCYTYGLCNFTCPTSLKNHDAAVQWQRLTLTGFSVSLSVPLLFPAYNTLLGCDQIEALFFCSNAKCSCLLC